MDANQYISNRLGRQPTRDPYLIKSVVHASELIGAFEAPGEILSLRELVARTHLSRGIVFRLLYTLGRSSMIEKIDGNDFRLLFCRVAQRKWKIGYGAPGIETQFTHAVADSLRYAAEQQGTIELLILDNRFKPGTAIHNADQFVRERADLVIEFQIDEEVGPKIGNAYRDANIPFIAVNNPLPGATYFGANNYEAGLIGGHHLGRWARQHWSGKVDEILMLALARAGAIPKSRLTGMVAGVRDILKDFADPAPVVQLDGNGQFEDSWHAIQNHLRRTKPQRVLIGAMNDNSALGALRAFQEAGREETCAVLGQNGSVEAREELRTPRTRFIGSVAYFPEMYGAALVELAVSILNRRFVPPAVFTKHVLLTAENVDRLYPNDALLNPKSLNVEGARPPS